MRINVRLEVIQTKNQLLSRAMGLVCQYNNQQLSAGNDKACLATLNDLVRAVGDYLTSKPPQPKDKNKARWDGMKDILDQVGRELVAQGGKLLKGPADFRTVTNKAHCYWLEAIDQYHRPASYLSQMFEVWCKDPTAISTKQSFWAYLGSYRSTDSVQYLSAAEREKFRIEFDNKAVLRTSDGEDFSTEKTETHFSGKGWAIYVVAPTGEIYAGTHKVDRFHHSSFLSGGAVKAAGEIVVDHGVVKMITAKSGHYRPSADEMLHFVRNARLLPWNAVIRPDMLDVNNGGKPVFLRLGDFRERGFAAAKRLEASTVVAELPAWARSEQAMKGLGLKP